MLRLRIPLRLRWKILLYASGLLVALIATMLVFVDWQAQVFVNQRLATDLEQGQRRLMEASGERFERLDYLARNLASYPDLTGMGYEGTFADGNTLVLNPLAPLGPLAYRYHLPTAAVEVEVAPRWSLNAAWNYHGYDEKGDSGPTLPRDFRGNVFTTSVHYAF